jgi:two-component system cell cycle sensor histidine kinase/response regulator CckA
VSPRAEKLARKTSTALSLALVRLFDAVHEGIYFGTFNADRDATIAANPHLKLIFGHPSKVNASLVRPFESKRFVDPKARSSFLERLYRDGSVNDYLLRLRRIDGTPFWAEVTAHIDHGEKSNKKNLSALIRDVSERRRLEDQGRDLHNQLLQAEKLAALGQTVSGVAHELNNPLATILTWAERLSSRTLDPVTKRGVNAILGESERAAKIVRNLLTSARKRHTTRAMIEVNQVVRETFALRSYEQRVSNIRTIDALASGLPQVFADPYHVKQVLLNLIINAEQAMLSANGRGTLVARTWYDTDKESVLLEINDDGPGVADEVQAKIFDPFFTTKAVGKGTGLGLTVAYAIMQDHGGRIYLKSDEGKGASFFVEFPANSSNPRPVIQNLTKSSSEKNESFSASVLIVEDEAALATAVSEAMTDAGFLVDRAGDGQEALDRVRKNAYDLVVCDLKMPRMDGRTFYRAIADASPSLARRIVFVTGDVVGTDVERFLKESGNRWLAKPFRFSDLLKVAREIIG